MCYWIWWMVNTEQRYPHSPWNAMLKRKLSAWWRNASENDVPLKFWTSRGTTFPQTREPTEKHRIFGERTWFVYIYRNAMPFITTCRHPERQAHWCCQKDKNSNCQRTFNNNDKLLYHLRRNTRLVHIVFRNECCLRWLRYERRWWRWQRQRRRCEKGRRSIF